MITRRRLLAALVVGGAYCATPAIAQAHPHRLTTWASVYGPHFYLPFNTTADGAPFDPDTGPQLVAVAHRTLPLGTHVTIEISPQPDAWGRGLRLYGALVPCVVRDRGPYLAGPDGTWDFFAGRDIDLTMGLLRSIGFFDPTITAFFGDRSEHTEALRWGVRQIKVHVHE